MGLLVGGESLPWKQCREQADLMRSIAVQQFIKQYQATWSMTSIRRWGDEIEYSLIALSEGKQRATLVPGAPEFLRQAADSKIGVWHDEYGRYMVESTPRLPYEGSAEYLQVFRSLHGRRMEAMLICDEKVLDQAEHEAHCHGEDMKKEVVVVSTLSGFPRMGVGAFLRGHAAADGSGNVACSAFIPDACINVHPRFPCLTRNIRERRGCKVVVKTPVFVDDQTTLPVENGAGAALVQDDQIYQDAMCFGMGMTCIQVTFSCDGAAEACRLYDAFIPIAPLLLALSASTAAVRGLLTETDVRWHLIESAVDDRTADEYAGHAHVEEESDIAMYQSDQVFDGSFPKSRYSSVSLYIDGDKDKIGKYNDVPAPIRQSTLNALLDAKYVVA